MNIWDQINDACSFGSIRISRIIDMENAAFPAATLFPNATSEHIRTLSSRFGQQHINPNSLELYLSFHGFIVKTERHTILVDSCIGNGKERPGRPVWNKRSGPFLKNLQKQGISPEEIDYVMCTHMHADHVGWNTKLENGEWVPTFPNAQYLFGEREYKFWKKKQEKSTNPIMYGAHADSVLPIMKKGQGFLIDSNHEISDGLFTEPAYGHTPGNLVLNVTEGSKTHAIICGDVMHHPIQLANPEWSSCFCENPQMSRATRLSLLNRFSDSDTFILPAHFQSPGYGPVERDGKGYRMKDGIGEK